MWFIKHHLEMRRTRGFYLCALIVMVTGIAFFRFHWPAFHVSNLKENSMIVINENLLQSSFPQVTAELPSTIQFPITKPEHLFKSSSPSSSTQNILSSMSPVAVSMQFPITKSEHLLKSSSPSSSTQNILPSMSPVTTMSMRNQNSQVNINMPRKFLRAYGYKGQFCNSILSTLDAIAFAKTLGYTVLIGNRKVKSYFEKIDLDLLQRVSGVEIIFTDKDPIPSSNVTLFNVNEKIACAYKTTQALVKHAFRPQLQEKEHAEKRLEVIKSKGSSNDVPIVSIHLRRMSCDENFTVSEKSRTWFRDWSVCHQDQNPMFDVEDEASHFCREGLDEYFTQSLREFPQFNTSLFLLFVSSDLGNDNDKVGHILDASFLDPDKKRKFGVEFTMITQKQDSMISDMWLSTLTDIHKGNTHSSCDSIVAMWRAELRNGSNMMIPKTCFSNYQFPRSYPHC